MKLLVVRYTREAPHDDPDVAAAFDAAAHRLAELPGLIWKLWAYEDTDHDCTSVYLFDSEENARAWGDGPLVPSLSSNPGIGDVELQYYDVDEHLSAITHTPLAAAAT
jgi:heme-degrading monooxygenase HmoA